MSVVEPSPTTYVIPKTKSLRDSKNGAFLCASASPREKKISFLDPGGLKRGLGVS